MKAGHGSGNLECPATHYYASQAVNLPHTQSHTQSHSQNTKPESANINLLLPSPPYRPEPRCEGETECSTDDSAVVTGDVETYCTSYM